MQKNRNSHYSDKEALDFHVNMYVRQNGMVLQNHLLPKEIYLSPIHLVIAAPVKEISKNPELAYDYTSKGNLVAVISNGSAILGLGI